MPSLEYTRKRAMGSEQEYGLQGESEVDWRADYEFLSNGGLVYTDCGHPEYASPETSNPLDAVKWDKAGELLIPKRVMPLKDQTLRFFKNNIDPKDNSYGAHESYTLSRSSVASRDLFNPMLGFMASRIIIAGAGSINPQGKYEISQKARSVGHCIIEGTTQGWKPIINTRDEPLANSDHYFRFHVVSGDGNLSQVPAYLKMGTTALMLDLFEDARLPRVDIVKTLDSYHAMSRDFRLKGKYRTSSGKRTAMGIQRIYLDAADAAYRGRDSMTDDILDRWDITLKTLERDPMEAGQLDWVIKKALIDEHLRVKGGKLGDDITRNIDLQYHEIGENGIFNMIQGAVGIERLVSPEEIIDAADRPPEDTRACARGYTVSWGQAKQVSWSRLTLPNEVYEIADPLDDTIPAEIMIFD